MRINHKIISGILSGTDENIDSAREIILARIEEIAKITDDEIHQKLLSLLLLKNAEMSRELQKKNSLIMEYNKELEMLNLQKNEFLGIVAHDLRNPLSVITMYTDYILGNTEATLPESVVELLGVIQRSSSFMLSLINDLLDFSKIEAGKLTLSRETVEYSGFLSEILRINGELAKQKNMILNPIIPHGLPMVTIDKNKIQQVINNLISNALKYCPADTEITVRVYADSDFVFTSVEDQGPGIPETDLKTIFTPFKKSSNAARSGEKSTGLGLAIVKKIVIALGGTIRAENLHPHGMRFLFSLPLG